MQCKHRERNNKLIKPYTRLQSQGHEKKAYRGSLPFNMHVACFVVEINSTLTFCLCRPTMTLH